MLFGIFSVSVMQLPSRHLAGESAIEPIALLTVWLLLFSLLVMSDSLWPHGLQLPCPSPSPWFCSNSCPLSQWCHPTTSFSVTPFLCSICPNIRVFSNESALWPLSRWPKYWCFSISPSNGYSGFLSGGQKQTKHSHLALESGHLRSFPGSINSIKLA